MIKTVIIAIFLFAAISFAEGHASGKVRAVIFDHDQNMYAQIWENNDTSTIKWVYANPNDANFSYIYGLLGQSLNKQNNVVIHFNEAEISKYFGTYPASHITRVTSWAEGI